jgi:hypothetical protein
LAISKAQNNDQKNIKTSSKLEELFPGKTRIKDWKKAEIKLGFKEPSLTMQMD